MTWLFPLDAFRAWAQDPDPAIRRWAVGRWMALYPNRDIELLAVHLMDDDLELQRDVALFLANTHDARWLPVLMKGHEVTTGRSRVSMVEALGVLGHSAAVPVLQAALRSARGGLELVAAIHALGRYRMSGAWQALAPIIELVQADDAMAGTLFRLLLDMGRRGDVARLMERWRQWEVAAPSQVQQAWASWLGVSAAELQTLSDPSATPDALLAALGASLTAEEAAGLNDAWGDPKQACRLLHRMASARLSARRDNLQQWLGEDLDVPRRDYRALALGSEALLASMAAVPPREDRRDLELPLALAALLVLDRRCDEARALVEDPSPTCAARLVQAAGAVPHPVEAVWVEDWETHGPWMLELLATTDRPELIIHLSGLVATHAEAMPAHAGSVVADALVRFEEPELVEPLLEAARALGEAAVPALILQLADASPLGAVRALGELPTERSFQALASRAVLHTHVDLAVAEALTNIGDARGIDILAPAWRPGMIPVAAMLTALANLHDSPHPNREAWRQDLDRTEAAAAMAMSGTVPES